MSKDTREQERTLLQAEIDAVRALRQVYIERLEMPNEWSSTYLGRIAGRVKILTDRELELLEWIHIG